MKRLRKLILALLVLMAIFAVVAFYLWRSDWLANAIQARAIAEIRKATGTDASIGKFEWDWQRGTVRVNEIVIRGHEAVTDAPFVRIATAEVTLKVISFLSSNVDVRAVKLSKPEVHIITYPDGTTNLPRRRHRSTDQVIAELLKLGIDRLDVTDGILLWNDQQIPFAIHAEHVDLSLQLDALRYQGTVQGQRVSLKLPGVRQFAVDLAAKVTLEPTRLRFEALHVSLDGLDLLADGELTNWARPELTAKMKANGPVKALVTHFDLPVMAQGEARASGELTYRQGWRFSGLVGGTNLGYQREQFTARGVNVRGRAEYTYTQSGGHRAEVAQLRADSSQGSFRGSLRASSTRYRLRGTIGNLQFDDAQRLFDPALPSWASLVNGPIDVDSDYQFLKFIAHLTLIPTDGDRSLSGTVNLEYDSRTQDVRLTKTSLQSNSTQVEVAGDLLGGLHVDLSTSNLGELPFVNRLPLRVESGGLVTFEGQVSGGIRAPAAKGQLTVTAISYQGEAVERGRAFVSARANLLALTQMELHRGRQTLSGAVQVSLFDWATRPASSLRGQVVASEIEVTPYLADARGRIRGTAELGGVIGDPKLEGNVEWVDAIYQNQAFGKVTGHVTYSGEQIDVRNGLLTLERQPFEFAGTYVHEPNDYRNGAFHATGKGSGVFLERLPQLHDRFPLVAGRLEIDARARGRLNNGIPDFNSVDGRAVIQQAAYDGKVLGALSLHAKTEAGKVSLSASGLLRGASLTASSQWQLSGPMTGQGQFALQGAKFDDFQDLVANPASAEDPSPFDLRLEATGTIHGNLREPNALAGNVKISQLAITPRQAMSDAARRDFTLRNDGPLEITYDAKGFDIRQAKLFAKDTKLTASGLVSTQGTTNASIHVVGDANVAVLSALKTDLLAAGNSTLDLTLRGSLAQPIMAGRMELRDASFFLRDVPNGLEKVNGVVFFDRSRARLENLTAQSGGGTIRLGGYIGFSNELTYQLQAQADNVRVRYPEGVSTAVNTALTLAGSASRSLLSGSVTLLRAALNPRTDLGALIAETGKSNSTPTRIENEFLKNMQFDVRIDTALNAQVTTSLTQNVEAEVNLRLRGTPARPVLLGRTSFTQGEISFFGTKYTIDRGEVNFYNQTKVEPTINLDLETRVRGVVVTINFSGPASKLNLSYRSDPPLQSAEILALLTVGRTPSGAVSGGANVQSPTFLQGASSALLGQAVAAPITGRLQRLFGVSRVRIDPQLTGLENTAQARLTIEQQVSRDVTVTFITNLNRTQQQIVSVEWDFSREFSALAIRDENGVFGLDFFYRKRFK